MTHPAPNRGGRLRVLARLSAIPVLALLAILGVAWPAAAHSELRSSSPASGASLDSPPRQVVLTFSDEVDSRFATVALTTSDTQPHALSPNVQGSRVAAEVDEVSSKAAGRWSVGYRVVSADGHPITGVFTFTVKQPAQPTPSPSSPMTSNPSSSQPSATASRPTSSATAAVAPAGDSQAGTAGPGFSVIVWIVAGSAVAIMAFGAALWRARNKSPG